MTNPAAAVPLTYDGSDLQAANLTIFLEIRRGLNEVPSVRGRDTVVPVLAGRIARSRVVDVLAIELYGLICADPTISDPDLAAASYYANWASVRALFASDRDPANLVATVGLADQVISARPQNIITVREQPGVFAIVSIELEGLGDWAAAGS